MLVETFMARDDNPAFDELVALALETGREGVKALKTAGRTRKTRSTRHQSRCPSGAAGAERPHENRLGAHR